MFSDNEAAVLAVKETLRYGLFLGSFAGTFVSLDELIAALGGHRRHAPSDFSMLLYIFFS